MPPLVPLAFPPLALIVPLLVTVPAYQVLWSLHDEANHHHRRYARRTLRSAALQADARLA